MTVRSTPFFCAVFFTLLIVMGCESPSSSPPHNLFAPDNLAMAPNPDDPTGQILYAGNPLTGPASVVGTAPSNSTITVIDLPAESPRAAPIVTGGILQDITVSQDGRQLFVTKIDGSGGLLVSYSTGVWFTETASAPITTGTPGETALSSIGNFIYIVTTNPNGLLKFSSTTFTQEAQVSLSFTPTVLGVSPRGAVLIGNPVSGTIEFFTDTSSLPISITVGGIPEGLSFSPDGSAAFVTVSSPPQVVAIDLSGTLSSFFTVSVSGIPKGIATAMTTTSLVFIANANGTFSAVSFSTSSTVMSLSLGGIPRQVVLSQDGTRAYVSNSLNNSIAVIDTGRFQNINTIQ